MSELLLELLSEEIPARMQTRASDDLKRLIVDGLKARGLEVGEARAYATPRRLTLVIEGVPAKSPAISDEKKGPRVGAPDQAVQGFLKSAGLTSIKDATVVKDEKKGERLILFTTADAKAEDISAHFRKLGLNELSVPKAIKMVEAIPVLGTGKTDYVRLNAMAAS